jgi:hypothetical protein
MKLSRAPVLELVLVSMGRYCQERATQVLNDFAAVGTFLLNYEETVSRWPGSCFSLTNGSMYRHSLFACAGQVRPSQPPQSRSGRQKRVLRDCNEMKRLIVVPNGLRLGTCQLSDGSVWPGGSGRKIPLTVRSPTSEDQYCEAFAGRGRCGVAVRNHAEGYQPFA